MTSEATRSDDHYEAPEVRDLGAVAELTQRCKRLGGSDFFIFRGVSLTCTSG